MPADLTQLIKDRIATKHSGDEYQLDVIFEPNNRLIVEAPAGYGKTNTMVSKIAYMIALGQIPNPKKLLALTFSVNAAYKIKKDVTNQVPALLAGTDLHFNISDKIYVSNYHGFARSVLKKYGKLFHANLSKIDTIQTIDDSYVRATQELVEGLSYDDALFMSEFGALIRSSGRITKADLNRYCDVLIKQTLPAGVLTYNGIICLTILLFDNYENVLKFYRQYYTTVLIDEFQDTNLICYILCKRLIADHTKVILLGDSLQRIYGFIGAVPDLMNKAETELSLLKKTLVKNYRFASNPQMLQLDQNIRRNAENPQSPKILKDAIINLKVYDHHSTEALEVIKNALAILKVNETSKLAILVKQRGANVNGIIDTFNLNSVPFFNGLFTDEDPRYITFHKKCLFEFIELIRVNSRVSKKLAAAHIKRMETVYKDDTNELLVSLFALLEVFWKKCFELYTQVSNDEKIELIRDPFENNGLKQYLEFVDAAIIITTVHAAKGLEWDFVILPDMEQESFPNYNGNLCARGACIYKRNCVLSVTAKNEKDFLEELSVFYVAVTRARKEISFFASRSDARGFRKNLSCFAGLPGIKY